MSSDCNNLVIGYSCFLKFSDGCFSNTVISEMLFGDVKTSHCCNLFHEAIYFVDTNWLNGVPDVRLGLGEGLQVKWA